METNEIVCPRVILCEGAGDAAFLKHLIAARNLPEFHITFPNQAPFTNPGGRSGFTSRLRALRLLRGFEQVTELIVISDNDDSPTRSFAEVAQSVRNAEGFEVPDGPATLISGDPRVGIYMLPEPNLEGQLETLCLQSCQSQWNEISVCLDNYLACNRHFAQWDKGKQEKMKMRIMISSICSTDPYTSLQYAWSRGDQIIPLDHGCFDGIATFLASVPAQGVL